MAIKKVSNTTKQLIREQSVLSIPDRPSEKGYSAQQLKEYFTNLVLGDVSSLTELDRVVEEINGYIEGIEDTTIKNFIVDTVISKFTQQAPFISLKFEDNKLKYTRFGNPSISGELDIIPENSVFFDNQQLKSKTNENIYPKTTLENIIGGIGDQSFKEYLLDIKTQIDKIESNHEIDIKSIEDSLSQIIGGDAPEALDSIKELAEALKNNPSSLDDILLQISNLRTGKVDVVAGKQLSTNDFDNSSKTFLDELKNKDVALKTDIKTNLSELKEDSQHRLVSDDEKSKWNSKADGVHNHNISDVNGLQGKLDLKSDVGHTHAPADLGAEESGAAMRLVSEHNQSSESHKDIREAIQDVSKKVDGINNALTFYNTQELQNWFNGTYSRPDGIKPSDLYVGQYLYVKDQDEDDYWVSETPATFNNLTVLQTDKIDLSGYAEVENLSRVAFSGNYNDLSNKPTIPTKLSELVGDAENRTITDSKLQQIDQNTTNIANKLDKNLGSSEANKMVITDSSGNVTTAPAGSMSALVDNLESDSTTMAPTANQVRVLNNIKLDKQQGTENAGKHLVVNDSGLVDLEEQPDYVTKTGFTMRASSTAGKFYYNTGAGEKSVQVKMPTVPTKTSQLTNDSEFVTSADIPDTSAFIPQGGTLTAPLTVTGGDGTTAGKIVLDQNNKGQITNTGTQTLFGYLDSTQLAVGHSSYYLRLRGNLSRPTYNGNSMALQSDIPDTSSFLPKTGGVMSGDIDWNNSSAWLKPYLLAFKNADGNQSPTYPYTGFYQWGNEWQVNARDANNAYAKNLMSINLDTAVATFGARPTVNGANIAMSSDLGTQATFSLSGTTLTITPK